MDLKSEKELIARSRKDPQVFGCVFDEYYPKILGFAVKRTGSVETAKDITAEVFCKALGNLWQFKWRNIPFSAWLYKITNNEINSFFRKNKYQTTSFDYLFENGFDVADDHDLIEELKSAEAELEKHEQFLEIQKQIEKLPIKYQEVITLRFFEEKKISEIAEILGKREGTVKSLLSRGLEKLREKHE